jgi:hypothetical protein
MQQMNTISDSGGLRQSARAGTLRLSTEIPYAFEYYCLRRVSTTNFEGDIGVHLPVGRAARLHIQLGGPFLISKSSGIEGSTRLRIYAAPDPGVTRTVQVNVHTGVPSYMDDPLGKKIFLAHTLRDQIYASAGSALSAQMKPHLHGMMNAAPVLLLDIAFAGSEDGTLACAAAESLDLSPAFHLARSRSSDVSFATAPLANLVRDSFKIELHLPFFDRRSWEKRFGTFLGSSIRCSELGQLIVSSPEEKVTGAAYFLLLAAHLQRTGVTASFKMGHTLPLLTLDHELQSLLESSGLSGVFEKLQKSDARALDANLEYSLSGFFLSSWFTAPGDKDPGFWAVYKDVSLAIQRALRQWGPRIWFQHTGRGDLNAYTKALLVYESSDPWVGAIRCELSRDPLSVKLMNTLCRSASARLLKSIEETEFAVHIPTRRTRLQARYRRDRILDSVRGGRLAQAVISGETAIIECFVNFGVGARAAATNPDARVIQRHVIDFVKELRTKLKRFHGAGDFTPLLPHLLMETTAALNTAMGHRCATEKWLRTTSNTAPEQFFFASCANNSGTEHSDYRQAI